MLENTTIALILFLLGFASLVVIHELGHFLVAKWVGIRVTQFAVGFGHAVLCWRKGIGLRVGTTEPQYIRQATQYLWEKKGLSEAQRRDTTFAAHEIHQAADTLGLGETEYRLNWCPLGGYVKMLGQEDTNPAARSEDPRAYNRKSISARLAVISAGVILNVISGLLFFIVAFMIGVQFPAALVGGVTAGSPAARTYAQGHEGNPFFQGLAVGDRVVELNGRRVTDMMDINVGVALGGDGQPRRMHVQRPGLENLLTFDILPRYSEEAGILEIGMMSSPSTGVAAVFPDSPVSAAGVTAGMRITSINDTPVTDYADFRRAAAQLANKPYTVGFADQSTGAKVRLEVRNEPLLSVARTPGQDSDLIGLVPVAAAVGVLDNSPAHAVGMQPGDVIVQLGDRSYPSAGDVLSIVTGAKDQPLDLVVLREQERVDLGSVQPRDGRIGIYLGQATSLPLVSRVQPESPAMALQLTPGSRILSLNGQGVENWADMQAALGSLASGFDALQADAAQLEIWQQQTQSLEIAYRLNVPQASPQQQSVTANRMQLIRIAAAGWSPNLDIALDPALVTIQTSDPWAATALGFEKTGQFLVQTYQTIYRLFDGSVATRNLRGPVGIVDAGTRFTQRGWGYMLFFLGLISVNLAVINFLPLPIVDGGHAVMLLYEKITGVPPGERFLTAIMLLGLALMLTLVVYLTYHDILRLITGSPY